jgi:teichuronic acid biosynthesis glycosyltransferase TuaG
MQDVLVSVVIPCHDSARYIGATLESVLAQTYRNIEVVVVDDGSADATVAVVTDHAARDRRISMVQLPRNHGAPAHPRNIGVKVATGAWIAFLDADDLWHPRKLEYQMNVLAQTGARMCSTEMRDFRSMDEVVMTDPASVRTQRISLRMQLMKYRTPTSSIVVERMWMLEHPFNEDPHLKAREDTDCFIRFHEYAQYSVKLGFPFVFYRLHGAGISGNKLRMVARHFHMLRKYRLRSGRSLGIGAYFYTLTHFVVSIYLRFFRGML